MRNITQISEGGVTLKHLEGKGPLNTIGITNPLPSRYQYSPNKFTKFAISIADRAKKLVNKSDNVVHAKIK